MDQTEVEALIHRKTNKILAELGVELNFITLTLDLDDQTRQAIDISTAMKIYESRGIQELGKEVMKERAGATKVTVNTKTVNTATPVE
jgi:transposase